MNSKKWERRARIAPACPTSGSETKHSVASNPLPWTRARGKRRAASSACRAAWPSSQQLRRRNLGQREEYMVAGSSPDRKAFRNSAARRGAGEFSAESRAPSGTGVGGEREPVSRSWASRRCHPESLDIRSVRKVGFQTEIKAIDRARSIKSNVT